MILLRFSTVVFSCLLVLCLLVPPSTSAEIVEGDTRIDAAAAEKASQQNELQGKEADTATSRQSSEDGTGTVQRDENGPATTPHETTKKDNQHGGATEHVESTVEDINTGAGPQEGGVLSRIGSQGEGTRGEQVSQRTGQLISDEGQGERTVDGENLEIKSKEPEQQQQQQQEKEQQIQPGLVEKNPPTAEDTQGGASQGSVDSTTPAAAVQTEPAAQQQQQQQQQQDPPTQQDTDSRTDDAQQTMTTDSGTLAGPGDSQTVTTSSEPETHQQKQQQQQQQQIQQQQQQIQQPPADSDHPSSEADIKLSPPPITASTVTKETGEEARKESEDQAEEEEDIKVPDENEEDKLPSFDEWKQKMLAEQAEQEKSKTVDVQNTQTAPATPGKSKGTKKVNYASATCGAKVRAANGEAQSPGFVLSENKDQYMINPCKAKKWFIVELCTPVQIQALEIGNLELFSSQPESFVAHISEGYPTKEWKPLGTFHARDERSVQSFSVDDELMYAHYIKVEMLSHYGSEHYCPLTVLRVYGLTVTEADDEEDSDHDQTTNEELDLLEESENTDSLFNSAKETVIGLVKTVLSQGEEEGEEDTKGKSQNELQDVVKLQGTDTNKTSQNASGQGASDQGDSIQPCVPEGSTTQTDGSDDDEARGSLPKTPCGTINKETPQDIVTLIETPRKDVSNVLSECNYCSGLPQCQVDRQTSCGYYRLWRYFYPTTCTDIKPAKKRLIGDQPQKPDIATQQTKSVSSIKPDEQTVQIQPSVPQRPLTSLQETTLFRDQMLSSDVLSSEVEIQPSTKQDFILQSSVGEKVEGAEDVVMATPSLSLDVSQSKGEAGGEGTSVIQTQISTSEVGPTDGVKTDSGCDSGNGCHLGPDPIQVRPATADTVPETATVTPTPDAEAAPESDKPETDSTSANQVQDTKDEASEPTEDGNGLKIIYAEDPATLDGDAELELEPPAQSGDDLQYQKLISGRKETTFMKLKNKIKALELNLNLSSQYLEELSQRYRRQMEDMYSSLNKTITKLANTSRKAEERDMKQQEHIKLLQEQIHRLDSSLDSLKGEMSEVNMQLMERQLYLMMVEAVIFLSILAWCLHRQEKVLTRGQGTRLPCKVQNPRPVRESTVNPNVKKRRNSTEGLTPSRDRSASSSAVLAQRRAYDDSDIKRAESESDLRRLVSSSIAAETIPIQWEVSKKKKKKKQASSQKSLQFGSLVGQTLPQSSASSSSSSQQQATNHCSSSSSGPASRGGANKRTNHRGSDTGWVQASSVQSKPSKSHHRKTPSLDSGIHNGLPLNNGLSYDGMDGRGTCNGHVEDVSRKWSKHSVYG